MISIYFRIEILGIYEKYLGKLIRLKFSRYEILGYMKQKNWNFKFEFQIDQLFWELVNWWSF